MKKKFLYGGLITCLFLLVLSCDSKNTQLSNATSSTSPSVLSPDSFINNSPTVKKDSASEENNKKKLYLALMQGNLETIPELAKNKINFNDDLEEQKIPPIHCLVYGPCKYSKEMLLALIAQGADIDKPITTASLTNDAPLNIALAKGMLDKNLVADLLDAKANPNSVGQNGAPLHQAIKFYRYQKPTSPQAKVAVEIIKLLLSTASIKPNLADKDGHEPLHYAYFDDNNAPLDDEEKEHMKAIVELFPQS